MPCWDQCHDIESRLREAGHVTSYRPTEERISNERALILLLVRGAFKF